MSKGIESERAFKRLREDVHNEILPRHIVTPENIWNIEIPSEPHLLAWYSLKALEIVQFFVSKNHTLKHSVMDYMERLRRIRVSQKNDITYSKTVGAGKASLSTILFLLECNVMILENRYKPFTLDTKLWCEKRGFVAPSRGRFCTQQQIIYNVHLLQKLWYKMRPTLDPLAELLHWLQFQVAHIVLINEEPPFYYMDGEDGRDTALVVERHEQHGKRTHLETRFKTCTMRFKNDMSCIFLDLFESFAMWQEIINDDDYELVRWSRQDCGFDESDWFEEVPPQFFDWFERQTRIIADSNFRARVVSYAMAYDMYPGEKLMFLARNNNVTVTDSIRVFQETRNTQQRNWWMRDALENDMFIDTRLLHSTGRVSLWVSTLLCVMDSVMQSRCKFKWKENVFYSECRFRQCQLQVISSDNPLIVQMMGSFFVYYDHTYYFVSTFDKAVFFWVYLMIRDFECQYSDEQQNWDLSELQSIWLEWTNAAQRRLSKPREPTTITNISMERRLIQDESLSQPLPVIPLEVAPPTTEIIVNEDSVLTTFEIHE